jgi:hypothetical protein
MSQENNDVRKFLILVLAGLIGFGSLTGAEARDRRRAIIDSGIDTMVEDGSGLVNDPAVKEDGYDQLAQQDGDFGITPSDAAAIASEAVPGARVVGVRLLSNGYYAVTLRAKGSVTRVMVNARDGSIR